MGAVKAILVVGILAVCVSLAVGEDDNTTTTAVNPTTTAPVTTKPPTTAPVTTKPITTDPVTTKPPTTAPVTTKPITTAPVTTKPITTAPVTTKPATNTTTPVATTVVTTPQPSTNATLNKYAYKNNKNMTCLKVQMEGHFELSGKPVVNVTSDAVVVTSKSSCSVLAVKFGDGDFEMSFGMTKDNGSYFLQDLEADVYGVKSNASNLMVGKASMKASYMCLSGITINLSNNISFVMNNLQYQAFNITQDKFGTAQICSGDLERNIFIPIVVGCALGGLIIIVVIAYLIGRRRAQHRYEAM